MKAPIARGSNFRRDLMKPRRYRTDRTCKGKRRMVTEVEARAVALGALTENTKTAKLWVYACRHCDGWHLTSHNQGRRWAVTGQC